MRNARVKTIWLRAWVTLAAVAPSTSAVIATPSAQAPELAAGLA